MPPPVLLPANLQLLSKRARCCRDDLAVAGKPPQFLAFPYQGFVGERLNEFALFLRVKFL